MISVWSPKRWATAIKTSEGVLLPEAVVVGAGHATLYASLAPGSNKQNPPGTGRTGATTENAARSLGVAQAVLAGPPQTR